jgi:hypothetical protein
MIFILVLYAEFLTLTEECEVTGLRAGIKHYVSDITNREDIV